MTKIIYYCDLHKGDIKPPAGPTDVLLYGQVALDMHVAVLNYAHSTNIDEIIHGGDESSFVKGDAAHHFRRASDMAQAMTYKPDCFHRVIGNHEPINHLVELGFKTDSYHKVTKNKKNRLVICQPTIRQDECRTIYSFEDKRILQSLNPRKNTNLIIACHWAFDRMARGYPELYFPDKGYAYRDTTKPLSDKLTRYEEKNPNRVLTLHGHEHRFSLTQDLGFNCLTMPAITQVDADDNTKACGLFAEITDDDLDGTLRFSFKKIDLVGSDQIGEAEVTDVNLNYMQRYYRPVLKSLFQ